MHRVLSYGAVVLQHYMLNSSINEQLADTADIRDGDVILEIGPGTGSLTNVLLDAGATVLAIEKVGFDCITCTLLINLEIVSNHCL